MFILNGMDETRFNELKTIWLENRAKAVECNRVCGVALRELIWTLADEGLSHVQIASKLGLGRWRVQDIMTKGRVLNPGYEDLHKGPIG